MKTLSIINPIRNARAALGRFATAVAAAAMLGAAPTANAQTINVNVDNTVRTGLVGPAGGSGKTWNTINANNGALKDENNATTTVTISGGGERRRRLG